METSMTSSISSPSLFSENVSKTINYHSDVQHEEQAFHDDLDIYDQSQEVPDIDHLFRRNRSGIPSDEQTHTVLSCSVSRHTDSVAPPDDEISFTSSDVRLPLHEIRPWALTSDEEGTGNTSSESQRSESGARDTGLARNWSSESLSEDNQAIGRVPQFEVSPRFRPGRRDRVVPDMSLFESDTSDDERSLNSCSSDLDHVVPVGFIEE